MRVSATHRRDSRPFLLSLFQLPRRPPPFVSQALRSKVVSQSLTRCGSAWPYYHSTSHAVPSAVTANSPTFPYPIPNYPDNMGLDTNATGPSTQPAAQIPHYVPPEEHYGCGCEQTSSILRKSTLNSHRDTAQAAISDPDPFGFSSVAPASITNNTVSAAVIFAEAT